METAEEPEFRFGASRTTSRGFALFLNPADRASLFEQ
jgi:hypothetical protein